MQGTISDGIQEIIRLASQACSGYSSAQNLSVTALHLFYQPNYTWARTIDYD